MWSVLCKSYIFTSVDMFSKILFAQPIRNKDALTVCEALYRLFTSPLTHGTYQTLIFDSGSELSNKFTNELVNLLEVTREFVSE